MTGTKYNAALTLGVLAFGAAAQLLLDSAGRVVVAMPHTEVAPVDTSKFSVPPTPLVPRSLPSWARGPVRATSIERPSGQEVEVRLFKAKEPVRVHMGPSEDSTRLGILRAGLPIRVVAEEDGWAKFLGPTGRAGWVERDSLVEVKP